jgi:hypothetical protein
MRYLILGEKDLTVEEPLLGIHQPLHLTDRGRVHRVPAPMNPDSAVEREVMSKEQTFRSEDNAFCL